MSFTAQQLYELLPAIHRIRDVEQGEPLKALIAVIAEQAGVMEEDIARLYENWFIETCEEWVVPYIGDLLRVRGLHPIGTEAGVSQRAYVANTISYRRRKGTATVLEQLAYDITGWRARAVEFFELLGTTQNYNHIRLHNVRTPDLRRTNELELLDTAFDTVAHTADVRHIATGRGRHNIPNVGLFLWRLQSYFVSGAAASAVADPADGRYTFNPLGYTMPLFNRPQTETEITHLAEEINVPGRLRRRALYDELEARRQALTDERTPKEVYFGKHPVFQIFIREAAGQDLKEVKPEEILICNLSEPGVPMQGVWPRPPADKKYISSDGATEKTFAFQVAVDPERGRLAFPLGKKPYGVKVGYAYGFSGDVGGGPYNRRASVDSVLTRQVDWQVGVSKEMEPVAGEIFATLSEAIKEWNSKCSEAEVGIIAILDSNTYGEDNIPTIKIPGGRQLLIVAADWPEEEVHGQPAQKRRILGRLAPDEVRPHVLGDLKVRGTAPTGSGYAGELAVNGLLVEGKLTVLPGNLRRLLVTHSTLVPDKDGLEVKTTSGQEEKQLAIDLVRSVSGPIKLAKSVSKLFVEDSVVDNKDGDAIMAESNQIEIQKSTILGRTRAQSFEAGNSIFTGRIDAERRQTGCVRFCYVPPGSETPRRFRCQPDLALEAAEGWEKPLIKARLVPSFNSDHYGRKDGDFTQDCGYAQLSSACANEIRTGAEDGSEMGAFSHLKQPQRESNLRAALNEYLRFGLEAGLIFVT